MLQARAPLQLDEGRWEYDSSHYRIAFGCKSPYSRAFTGFDSVVPIPLCLYFYRALYAELGSLTSYTDYSSLPIKGSSVKNRYLGSLISCTQAAFSTLRTFLFSIHNGR